MGSITISPLNAKISYVSRRDPFVEKMAVALCVCDCKPLVFPSTMHATLFYHCDNFHPQRLTSPAVDSNTDFFMLISHFTLE
jgi:hypothetical protein